MFHLLNRGVDKRKIFLDNRDRFRFIHDLFEFNDIAPADNNSRSFHTKYDNNNLKDVRRPSNSNNTRPPRRLLVDLIAFCLMGNHYHLLVQEKVKNGISLFMKKLNGGYAKYFNERYERSGALFQGKYKSVEITDDAHFIHIPYYIHCNPLDMFAPEWRDGKVRNIRQVKEFLDSYRWSSHLDYCGKHNFPSVTQRYFLDDFFEGPSLYEDAIYKWLSEESCNEIGALALD